MRSCRSIDLDWLIDWTSMRPRSWIFYELVFFLVAAGVDSVHPGSVRCLFHSLSLLLGLLEKVLRAGEAFRLTRAKWNGLYKQPPAWFPFPYSIYFAWIFAHFLKTPCKRLERLKWLTVCFLTQLKSPINVRGRAICLLALISIQ